MSSSYAFEDSNSRFGNKGKLVLIISSSCGQEDSNCNGVVKRFDEVNNESQVRFEDCGQDLMR